LRGVYLSKPTADIIFLKISLLAEIFSLVYVVKQSELHLPHLQTSSFDNRDGWLAMAEGMPALNEWPEKLRAVTPRCLNKRFLIVRLNVFCERYKPELKVKTGRFL
jgi:hypothetical protein